MMVGRDVQFAVDKKPCEVGKPILEVENLVVPSKVHKNNAVRGVSFNVRAGEIVCVAGIDGNGQSELIYGITGLEKPTSGTIRLRGQGHHECPHPRAQQGRYEPHPGGPPQARSGAGLHAG